MTSMRKMKWKLALGLGLLTATVVYAQVGKEVPIEKNTYLPVVITDSFDEIRQRDSDQRERFRMRQEDLLERRYRLGDMPSEVMMSAGRKPVQRGVRVKLHGGVTWDELAEMSPAEIREQDLFPMGFRPLPHAKHGAGGQVFPQNQIDAMMEKEQRDLERFDIAFDLPDHLTPEFPPPIYLTTRPDLGDVSQGQVLSI
ncbi:MAG: cytochrome B6, partial [Planctomycetota bacterium]|nr:cytochrome B6 [Planctomycetota bacterium]